MQNFDFFNKIREILQSDSTKYFITLIKKQVIDLVEQEGETFNKDLVSKVVKSHIDKLSDSFVKSSLQSIQDYIIDFTYEELVSIKENSNKKTTFDSKKIAGIKKVDKEKDVLLNSSSKLAELLVKKGAVSPLMAVEVIKEMVDAVKEYYIVKEEETTKRVAIEAEKQIYLSKIEAQKEFLMSYLEKTFDERSKNFEKFFEVVDKGLESNNEQILFQGLNAITDLAKLSPFKEIENLEIFKNNLIDDNYEWDM